jgi:hypothetical protein
VNIQDWDKIGFRNFSRCDDDTKHHQVQFYD